MSIQNKYQTCTFFSGVLITYLKNLLFEFIIQICRRVNNKTHWVLSLIKEQPISTYKQSTIAKAPRATVTVYVADVLKFEMHKKKIEIIKMFFVIVNFYILIICLAMQWPNEKSAHWMPCNWTLTGLNPFGFFPFWTEFAKKKNVFFVKKKQRNNERRKSKLSALLWLQPMVRSAVNQSNRIISDRIDQIKWTPCCKQ